MRQQFARRSSLEETLAGQIGIAMKIDGIPEPEREFRFHQARQWRADFAWPDHFLLVECEGGVFARFQRNGQAYGWHQSVARYLSDMEKYNAAALLGFRVLRYSAREIYGRTAIQEIEVALKGGIALPRQIEGTKGIQGS